jgi:hypothetical protein
MTKYGEISEETQYMIPEKFRNKYIKQIAIEKIRRHDGGDETDINANITSTRCSNENQHVAEFQRKMSIFSNNKQPNGDMSTSVFMPPLGDEPSFQPGHSSQVFNTCSRENPTVVNIDEINNSSKLKKHKTPNGHNSAAFPEIHIDESLRNTPKNTYKPSPLLRNTPRSIPRPSPLHIPPLDEEINHMVPSPHLNQKSIPQSDPSESTSESTSESETNNDSYISNQST